MHLIGAKPLLFTHVYECKVFARIVCGSACVTRERNNRVFSVGPRACRERVQKRDCVCVNTREGVSTLGELLFREPREPREGEEDEGRSFPHRFTLAPLQTDVEKTSFFPSLDGSFVNTLKEESSERASERASETRLRAHRFRLRSIFQKY